MEKYRIMQYLEDQCSIENSSYNNIYSYILLEYNAENYPYTYLCYKARQLTTCCQVEIQKLFHKGMAYNFDAKNI